jgi:AcrR family transcriptional regulator
MDTLVKPRGRKSGRGESVRDALIRAGQTLFSLHPVDAVAVDDVIREAEVAKGSFYKHFPDKEALLEAVVQRIFARIEHQVNETNAMEVDAAARVARAICVYMRFVAAEPEQGGVLVRNNRSGWSLPQVEENQGAVADVRQGLLTGRFVIPTVEAGVLIIHGAAHAGLTCFTGAPGATSNIAIAEQLCQLVLCSLGVPTTNAQEVSAAAAAAVLPVGQHAGEKPA